MKRKNTGRLIVLFAAVLVLGLSVYFRTSALSPAEAASTGFYARQGLRPAAPQSSAARKPRRDRRPRR